MQILTAQLIELTQWGSEILGVLDLPHNYWPQPGQYLPCQRVDDDLALLPTPLFCTLGDPQQLILAGIPAGWGPGDVLAIAPPQGRGFDLPKSARRVGLIPFDVSPARLLSLLAPALAQDGEVALFCDQALPMDVLNRIPSRVEVLSLSDLMENPDWPDYVAVDLERIILTQFIEKVDPGSLPGSVEVLVRTAMPCRGVGACGVCAVQTRRGDRFACTDGPVFPLKELRHVA